MSKSRNGRGSMVGWSSARASLPSSKLLHTSAAVVGVLAGAELFMQMIHARDSSKSRGSEYLTPGLVSPCIICQNQGTSSPRGVCHAEVHARQSSHRDRQVARERYAAAGEIHRHRRGLTALSLRAESADREG